MSTLSTETKLESSTLFAILVALISWASSFVFIRVALDSYSPGALGLLRYLVVSVVMLFFYLPLKKKAKPTKKEALHLFLLGFFGIGLYMIALNYGELYISASITSFIIGLNPIIVMLWAWLFFKEKISYKRWLGVLVSVIGLIIISYGAFQHEKLNAGILIILFAVVCTGSYNAGQKPLLTKFHPFEVAAIVAWIGTLTMLIFTPSLMHEIRVAPLYTTASVVYLGVFPGAIGYTAWSFATARVASPSKLALVLYTMPLLTTFIGWVILHQMPTMTAFLGGCVALMGALIATRF